MSGRTIPTILGKGWRLLGVGPLFGLLMVPWNCHGASGRACSLLREDQGLEVHSSAILDPFDSNWFMLCPRAMSFSQKLCPALCPPVTSSATSSENPTEHWELCLSFWIY